MDRPWFAPRRYGIGAGAPIAWQGWALLLAFIVALVADLRLAPTSLRLWLAAVLIAAFSVVAAAKTDGGWRWRWGRED